LSKRSFTSSTPKVVSADGGHQDPSIQVGSAPKAPSPIPTIYNHWVKRTYSAVFTEALAGEGVQFRANGFGLFSPFFVEMIRVWMIDTSGGVGLNTGFYQVNSTDLGNNDVVNAEDYGNASSLPGVTFVVPAGHATEVAPNSSAILVDAKNVAVAGKTGRSTFVAHLHCWVAI